MRIAATLILASLLSPAVPIPAQDSAPASYRVEFNIRDGGDSSAKAGRRYTMLIDNNSKGTFKAGDKVRYATASFQPGVGASAATQYTYLDTGVNIDCFLRESNGKVAIHGEVDISAISQQDKAATNPLNPTVASTKVVVSTMVNPGKPTVVASIDDPVSPRKFDVEVTVTK